MTEAMMAREATRDRWRRRADMARLLWQLVAASPWAVLVLVGVLVVGGSTLGVTAAATGGFVEAAVTRASGHRTGHGPGFWLAVYAVASAVENFYWNAKNLVIGLVRDAGLYRLQRQVLGRAGTVPLARYEDDAFFDRLNRAANDLPGRLNQLVQTVADQIQVLVMVGSVVAVLALIRPVIVLLLVAGGLPAVWLQSRVAMAGYQVSRAHTGGDRVRGQLQGLLTGREAAPEVRLFGSAGYLIGRWHALRQARSRDMLAAEGRRTVFATSGSLLSGGGYAAALVLVSLLILHGHLDLGDYVTVAMGALFFEQVLGAFLSSFAGLDEHALFLGDLFAFLRQAQPEDPAAFKHHGAAPTAGPSGCGVEVVAEGVTFAYPSAPGRPAVRDISLRIAPGEHVAVVGENGAGKTTLAKLVVGLYAPDRGSVQVDGVPAATCRYRTAAVFQDFVRYELTLRENVAVGNLAQMGADGALREALRRAELDTFAEGLPIGLDTYLGRQFGETDLSGGQWQRLALARAFLRDADLLLLDEPTAALDPLAELALFERFAELAERRTAVMISHRLAAARVADRVLVMEGGRIVEDGPHEVLLAKGGAYARLWQAQAQWYRAAAADG